MRLKINYRQSLIILLLAIVPVALLFTGIFLRQANQEFSLFAIDPEFSYLYSGVLLGQGYINLFMDHPGTPLIVLAAIVTRIVHLFRPGLPYAEDVLANPDFYLGTLNISLILLVVIAVFITGLWVYRRTKNLPTAVFLQFMPFVIEYVYSSLERFMPEPFLIAVVVVLAGMMVIDVFTGNDHSSWKQIVRYGLIIGLGISLKFTFAPFIVAPFFLIRGLKKKAYYLGAVVVSFLIITFPLLKRGNYFYNWIKSIIVHSGKYGSGEATVIDPDMFFANLKSILLTEKHLLYVIVLAILVLLLTCIPFLRRRIENKKLPWALTGITLTLIFGLLAISKHYAAYYLIPYSLLTVFPIYLSINILLQFFGYHKKPWVAAILFTGVAILLLINPRNVQQHLLNMEARKQDLKQKHEIRNQIGALQKADALVLISDNWHIKKESGLIFGMVMTPAGGYYFGEVLTKIYPNTYLFKEWDGNFYDWFDKKYTATELLEKHPEIHAVVKHYNPAVYDQIQAAFNQTGLADVKTIFEEATFGTKVFSIRGLPDPNLPD